MTLADAELDEIAERVADLLADRTPPRLEQQLSPYMTIPEAAEFLRCSRQRVDDLLSQRRLARVKEGARTLIRRDELAAYLDRGTRRGTC